MADGYPDEITLISGIYKAVSIRHAMAKGILGFYTASADHGTRIDLNTDSPGKQAMDAMRDSAIHRIEQSPSLTQLLQKPVWSKEDRVFWENALARIARDEIYDSPRYGNYRLDKKKPTALSVTEITQDTNFHCEPMAVVNAMLVQQMEDRFLQPSNDKGNLKRQTDYYVAGGILYTPPVKSGESPKKAINALLDGELLHGYVISPITANYIEATLGRANGWEIEAATPYRDNDIPDYSFTDFLAGFPLMAGGQHLTQGYVGTAEARDLAAARKKAIEAGDYASLDTLISGREAGFNLVTQMIYSNERSQLIGAGPPYPNFITVDTFHFINEDLKGLIGGPGRSYLELIRDARNVDFFMTPEEISRANLGNGMVAWALHSSKPLALFREAGSRVCGKTWSEKDLVHYLAQRNVTDIWLHRTVPGDAEAVADNFEREVRKAYDQIPEEARKVKNKDGNAEISFADYLAICREEYLAIGGAVESINAPGAIVPVIANPQRRWLEYREQKGRTAGEYRAQDVVAAKHTVAVIQDNPGTANDKLKLIARAILNGFSVSFTTEACDLKIPDVPGDLAPPPPVEGAAPVVGGPVILNR